MSTTELKKNLFADTEETKGTDLIDNSPAAQMGSLEGKSYFGCMRDKLRIEKGIENISFAAEWKQEDEE